MQRSSWWKMKNAVRVLIIAVLGSGAASCSGGGEPGDAAIDVAIDPRELGTTDVADGLRDIGSGSDSIDLAMDRAPSDFEMSDFAVRDGAISDLIDAFIRDVAICYPSCDGASCMKGEECASVPEFNANFAPSCLVRCTVSGDCRKGGHCVGVNSISPNNRYCIFDDFPASCGKGVICDVFVRLGCNGTISVGPYHAANRSTCGVEYVRCNDGGCVDGGGCIK